MTPTLLEAEGKALQTNLAHRRQLRIRTIQSIQLSTRSVRQRAGDLESGAALQAEASASLGDDGRLACGRGRLRVARSRHTARRNQACTGCAARSEEPKARQRDGTREAPPRRLFNLRGWISFVSNASLNTDTRCAGQLVKTGRQSVAASEPRICGRQQSKVARAGHFERVSRARDPIEHC